MIGWPGHQGDSARHVCPNPKKLSEALYSERVASQAQVDYRYTGRDEFAHPREIHAALDPSARCATITSSEHVAM
jgi:hypothetical protein